MSTLFTKLNLKAEQELVILQAPGGFDAMLAELPDRVIHRSIPAAGTIQFALVFVQTQADVDRLAQALAASAGRDPTIWFAYPKQSSKRYTCEFNRDSGWAALGELGYEPVRQVAIDEDWSALRFRQVAFITSLTRDPARALSQAGRQRSRE